MNKQWQSQIFAQALAATLSGTHIFVGDYPETHDLVERGFLKLDKRKKDGEGNWSATAVAGVTQDQVDAALNADAAPAPAPAPAPVTTLENVAVETAPITTLENTVTQIPTPATPDNTAVLQATAQPVFGDTQVAAAAAAAGDTVIGGADHAVVDTVTLGEDTFAIETGVQFVKRAPNTANLKRATVREDKYPFAAIADLKAKPENINNDEYLPSFHIVGKQVKNMSGMLARYIAKYEASHGVTFRAQQVKAGTDPQGDGVRVFAMNKTTAPARKSPSKKKGTEQAATAESLSAQPQLTPVTGYEGVQQQV